MLLSFITPIDYIEEFGSQGDFILALSHLLPSSTKNSQNSVAYEQAILKTGLPIYLDNGCFENHFPEAIDTLIEKAIKLKAELFFAPDALYDRKRTMIELRYAIDLRNLLCPEIKIGAIVQADNTKDYMEQLIEFQSMKEVDVIGLSILSIPKSYNMPIVESRITLMKDMLAFQNATGIVWKPMHLLGQGDSQKDILFAKENCPWILSNDSSCCFQSGLFGKRLTDDLEVPDGKVKNKVVFGLMHITVKQREDIQYNINLSKKIICLK